MASSGVNLLLCATTHGDSGVVAFIADDEAAAQKVLEDPGIGYQLQPALTVRIENRPGAGAATFRTLADVGINVDPQRDWPCQVAAASCHPRSRPRG